MKKLHTTTKPLADLGFPPRRDRRMEQAALFAFEASVDRYGPARALVGCHSSLPAVSHARVRRATETWSSYFFLPFSKRQRIVLSGSTAVSL